MKKQSFYSQPTSERFDRTRIPHVDPTAQQEDLTRQLNGYMGMSDDQLRDRLFQVAAQSRAQGTLDNDALDRFYQSASGMLDPQARARLAQLIAMLKQ